jgi:hypothetical protein
MILRNAEFWGKASAQLAGTFKWPTKPANNEKPSNKTLSPETYSPLIKPAGSSRR